jgi:peptide/nickel transport system permease protein
VKQIAQLVARRLLQFIPVMVLATFASFVLVNLAPGNIAVALLGNSATPDQIRKFNLQLGLEHPIPYRYVQWFWHMLHGDLGHSYVNGQLVTSALAQRLPVTLELVILGLLLAMLTAIPVSILVVRRPMKFADWASRSVAMVGLSMPGFVFGPLLIYVFAVRLQLLPSLGYVPITQNLLQNLKIMILPALTLSLAFFATYTRILRGDMVDQLMGEEYVQTARSKGLSEWRIIIRHVFKNSIFSFITVLGSQFGVLIGGTVIVEQVFTLTGMGQLLQNGINQKDSPVVQGAVTVICVSVVVANLITDMLYVVLDPRVRYGSSN